MRTQFLFVGLLSAVAGMLVGTTGCDNITAGQPTDSTAPPRLKHVFIQDARYRFGFPNRASVVDLVPNPNPASCTNTNPINPCLFSFLIDQASPDVQCVNNLCTDPLSVPATGVPLALSGTVVGGAPDMRDPGGGQQIRFVFDKVLANGIEMVMMDPTKAPGTTDTYSIEAGLLELDDATGKEVSSEKYYDNGGSPNFSADLELVPLGPAIVIKPKVALDDATTYTLKITKPGDIKDRTGNAAVGADGNALPTSFTFKTENLTSVEGAFMGSQYAGNTANAFFANAGPPPLDYPVFIDGTMNPVAPITAKIAPNEVIQISFYAAILGDGTKVTVTGPTNKALGFSDRGSDATMCTKSDGGGYVLDVMNSDTGDPTTAKPVDWAAGDYTLVVKVPSATGKSTFTSTTMKFPVAGMDVTDTSMDGNIATSDPAGLAVIAAACAMKTPGPACAGHLLPAQCAMP